MSTPRLTTNQFFTCSLLGGPFLVTHKAKAKRESNPSVAKLGARNWRICESEGFGRSFGQNLGGSFLHDMWRC